MSIHSFAKFLELLREKTIFRGTCRLLKNLQLSDILMKHEGIENKLFR
jgi:hypothetical protein